jgi:hypothetical protein
MNDMPSKGRTMMARLQQGTNISEPALYYSSLAQSEYSELFTSNASDLLKGGAGMTDFAVPGALYMIRHGLELWLKCVIANHRLDDLLRTLIREDAITFEELCVHERFRGWLTNPNVTALRRGLCVLRNNLVDGLVRPDCWTKRISDRYANLALTLLRGNPSMPRNRIDVLYVPLIGGHDLQELWKLAQHYVDGIRIGAEQHADEFGGGPPLNQDSLEQLVTFLHHIDPDGDALRYPFSLRGEWHAHELRLSLDDLGHLARDLTESTRSFTGFRSDVYTHGTMEDPAGMLYFGYYT